MQGPRPPKLIIHAGFHKTGTSSVQKGLAQNRALLADYRILLKPDISPLCAAALAFARAGDAATRMRFQDSLRRAVAPEPGRPAPQVTVISAEDLAGLIPGRRRRRAYPAAKALMAAMIEACAPQIPHIYLSTRAHLPWLKSCYAHHLRHHALAQDFAAYASDYGDGPALAEVASEIARQVAPVPVSQMALDDMQGLPQGPLTPLLDLMGVPVDLRAKLTPAPVVNAALPADLLDGFLELNQSGLDRASLQARKQAMIQAHRRSQR